MSVSSYRQKRPGCELCALESRGYVMAVEVHHILGRISDDHWNLSALCVTCHHDRCHAETRHYRYVLLKMKWEQRADIPHDVVRRYLESGVYGPPVVRCASKKEGDRSPFLPHVARTGLPWFRDDPLHGGL